MSRIRMLAAAAGVAVAQGALGQDTHLNDDFDCYQPGAPASTLPGWELWPGGEEGFVTEEQAFSGARSLHLNQVNTDIVRRVDFRDVPVRLSVMTYVPRDSVGLEGYLIGLSQYDGSGPGTISNLQIQFHSTLGHLEAQYRGDRTPLIFDRWVELRAEIDLAADLYDLYYDGELWAEDLIWSSFSGVPIVAAVDFYIHTLDSGPGMYIDDVVVVEAGFTCPPTCGAPGAGGCKRRCYADCDGSGLLDFFDFVCFQNLFAAADPRADCDQDGDLTFFDFLCFQNAFAAGCP